MNRNTTVAEIRKQIKQSLAGLYDENEIGNFTDLIFQHLLNYSKIELRLKGNEVISQHFIDKIAEIINRLRAFEPVQYILGETLFYDLPMMVSPDVLIPRPETEELVDWIIRENSGKALRILDIGTGSGCIAITLALERPFARITAVDRFAAALGIAQRNAGILSAHVEFLTSDWFNGLAGRRFDLIVSNPPYIATADPHLTRGDVRFEPPTALAAGVDGLDDLRHLAAAAGLHLKPGGRLLLEHGYDQGAACRALLRQAGFSEVTTLKDLAGLDRVTLGHLATQSTVDRSPHP